MAGAVLSVTVTIDGEEYTDLTAAVAGEDKSAEVELVDDYGLQSDGTGIIGDVLTVTYGADFGTPTNISWYKNGKVVQTNSVGDIVNNGLSMRIEAGGRWGVGTYKVTITNTDGDMATTNEIVITDKEEPAEILDFTLEDDYTDGWDLHYNTTDKRAIATVTMSKNYDGTFRIYRSTDTAFKTALATDTLKTSIAAPAQTAAEAIDATNPVNDQASILTTNPVTNYQVLRADTIGSGYGYINDDGTVTYKWLLNDTGVERGASYVVTFDQQSISSDTPGTGTANVVDEAAVAPYIEAPASIAVTKVSAGVKPEITFQGSDGNALGWFGYTQSTPVTPTDPNNKTAGQTTTLANVSATSAQIYSATSKTNDKSASGVNAIASGVANRNGDNIVKGVWTSNDVAGEQAYFFATVKFAKGIFGAKELELTSEAAPTAQPAATDMTILEDKTTASSAVVSFSNLRAPGTVYVARGRFNGAANNNTHTSDILTVQDIIEAFKANDPTTYVTSMAVDAGAASVTIPNAIGSFTNANTIVPNATSYYEDGTALTAYTTGKTYYTDDYVAIFVPDDTDNYGQITTSAQMSKDAYSVDDTVKTFNSLRVTSVPKTISYDKNTRGTIRQDALKYTITGTKLLAKDQFGNVVHTAASATDVTSVTVNDDALSTNRERAKAKYSVADTGVVTVVLETATTTDAKDGYVIELLGSKITLKALQDVATDTRNPAQSLPYWNVTFGSDNLIDNDEVVTLAGLTLTQAVVTTPNPGVTITVSGTTGIVNAYVTGTTPNVASLVDGRVITLTPTANTGAATVTVTITGANFTRTVTYAPTTDSQAWTPASLTVATDVVTANP